MPGHQRATPRGTYEMVPMSPEELEERRNSEMIEQLNRAKVGQHASGRLEGCTKRSLPSLELPWWSEPEREVDPDDPWSDEFLSSRIDFEDELAGKKQTQQWMNDLSSTADTPEAEEARQKAVAGLAAERGVPVEEMQAQFDTFKEKRAEADKIRQEKGLPPVTQLSEEPADHMGSLQQLRAGSYAGKAFGIDPIFGAMLSPTAGLVGPGNDSYQADADSVASYHGEAHDMFGYLQNYHDYGPGYRYATATENGEEADPRLRPYTGQASGFRKWNELLAEQGKADPDHPNDPSAQMRESMRRLGSYPEPLNPEDPYSPRPYLIDPMDTLPVEPVADVLEWILT